MLAKCKVQDEDVGDVHELSVDPQVGIVHTSFVPELRDRRMALKSAFSCSPRLCEEECTHFLNGSTASRRLET